MINWADNVVAKMSENGSSGSGSSRQRKESAQHRSAKMTVHFHQDGEICPSSFGLICPLGDIYDDNPEPGDLPAGIVPRLPSSVMVGGGGGFGPAMGMGMGDGGDMNMMMASMLSAMSVPGMDSLDPFGGGAALGGMGGAFGGMGAGLGGMGAAFGGMGAFGGMSDSFGGMGAAFGGMGDSYGGMGDSFGGMGGGFDMSSMATGLSSVDGGAGISSSSGYMGSTGFMNPAMAMAAAAAGGPAGSFGGGNPAMARMAAMAAAQGGGAAGIPGVPSANPAMAMMAAMAAASQGGGVSGIPGAPPTNPAMAMMAAMAAAKSAAALPTTDATGKPLPPTVVAARFKAAVDQAQTNMQIASTVANSSLAKLTDEETRTATDGQFYTTKEFVNFMQSSTTEVGRPTSCLITPVANIIKGSTIVIYYLEL